MIRFGETEYAVLPLFTRKEVAQAKLDDFCATHNWPTADIEIRTCTFVEACELARTIPTPVKLAGTLGECEGIIGVAIIGKFARLYPL